MENRNIKYIKFSGGLGNLLFQFCFGLYLANKFQCEIRYFESQDTVPGYQQLNSIVRNIKYASSSQIKKEGYYFNSKLLYRIRRKCLLIFPFMSKKIMVENGSNYVHNIAPSYSVFDGYWQSFLYFKDIQIHDFISFSEDVVSCNYVNDIKSVNSVFVHIRRGDYMDKKNNKIFHACSFEYFDKAFAILKNKLGNPTFFIFSNDMDWVRTNFKLNSVYNIIYVVNKGESIVIKDFYCMMSCKHAIISNSTFGWWAAWLMKNKNKQVIAPRQWYNKDSMNIKTLNLIPNNWIRL